MNWHSLWNAIAGACLAVFCLWAACKIFDWFGNDDEQQEAGTTGPQHSMKENKPE